MKNLFCYSVQLFLVFSCKSAQISDIKVARSENAPLVEKVEGLINLINWTNNKYSKLDHPASFYQVIIDNPNISVSLNDQIIAYITTKKMEAYKKLTRIIKYNYFSTNSMLDSGTEPQFFLNKLYSGVSLKDRHRLLERGLNTKWTEGKPYKLDFASFYLLNSFLEGKLSLFSQVELEESLDEFIQKVELNFSQNLSLAKYNGNLGKHEFYDSSFQKVTDILAYFAFFEHGTFIRAVLKNEQAKRAFFNETNTMSELSRVEAFDIIANRAGILLNRSKYTLSKDRDLQNFLNASLKNSLGMEQTSFSPIQAKKIDDGLEVYCLNSNFKDSQLLFTSNIYQESGFLENKETFELCGNKEFKLRTVERKSQKLAMPKPFEDVVKVKSTLKVKTYLTLAKEISPNYMQAFFKLANFHGFKKKAERIVNARVHFANNLKDADVLIYAGHVLSAGKLDIGSTSNKSIVLEGYRNGRKLELEIVFPDSGAQLSITKLEMINLYRDRINFMPSQDPLFVFVTSCSSSSNIFLWPTIHREAVINIPDAATRKDMPYVIASHRGFDTSSALEILSHVFYPIDVINMVNSENSIDEIYRFLKSNEYDDLAKEAKKRTNVVGKAIIATGQAFHWIYKKVDKYFKTKEEREELISQETAKIELRESEDRTFNPAYSFANENLNRVLSISGYYVEILEQNGTIVSTIDL